MEDFDERKNDKGSKKANGEILSENCHRQEGFYDGLADFIIDTLYFGITETSKKCLEIRKNILDYLGVFLMKK
jgi:hypothetical protein